MPIEQIRHTVMLPLVILAWAAVVFAVGGVMWILHMFMEDISCKLRGWRIEAEKRKNAHQDRKRPRK